MFKDLYSKEQRRAFYFHNLYVSGIILCILMGISFFIKDIRDVAIVFLASTAYITFGYFRGRFLRNTRLGCEILLYLPPLGFVIYYLFVNKVFPYTLYPYALAFLVPLFMFIIGLSGKVSEAMGDYKG